MRTLLLLSVLLLPAVTTNAVIVLNYDNGTGNFSLSGGDPGPGDISGPVVFYLWSWGNPTEAVEVQGLLVALDGAGAISGTVGGAPISTVSVAAGGGFEAGLALMPATNGALALNPASGAVAPGIWSGTNGLFVGAPGYLSSTTDNFNVNITGVAVVPEPSTYLAAISAIGLASFVYLRRRRRAQATV